MAKQKKDQNTTSKSSLPSSPRLQGKKLYGLIIFVFSFALYFNTLFNDYNLDDELVTQNHQVTSKGWVVLKFNFDALSNPELKDSSFSKRLSYFLPEVFRVPYYQDKAGFKYEYRPIVFASFALEHALFSKKTTLNGRETESDSPGISHFINVVLYATLCTLLFFILCNLFNTYSPIFPLLICLLFAAFPMHTEVVASIKNRDEILALLFGSLSLYFSIFYIKENKPGYLVFILLLFTAGILSKPTVITFALLIPLCAVFFSSVSYRKLMVLALVLIIPTVFYARLYSIVQQVALAFVLFVAISFLFILKNPALVLIELKELLRNFYALFKTTNATRETLETGFDLNKLQNPFSAFLIITGAVAPCCIATFGISTHDPFLSTTPFFFSALLFILVSNEIKVIFTTPLALAGVFAMTQFPQHSSLIETGLIVFLASQIFSGSKAFRTVGIINYLIFSLVSAISLHSYHFLFILFFVGLLDRKLWAISLLFIAGSVIIFVKKTFLASHNSRGLSGIPFLFPVFYVFVFLLWKNKWRQAVNASAMILPLSLLVYYIWMSPVGNNNTYQAAQRLYYRVNEVKAADPTPVQSVRPLNYLEYPLNNTDPISLKLGTAMEVLGHYLRMTIVPYPMSYYYGYSYITPQNLAGLVPLLSLLLHLFFFITALYLFRKSPVLSFSLLFYLISIAVFSNLVRPIPGMIADRLLLIPSIGFCILVTYLLPRLFKENLEDSKLTARSLKKPLMIAMASILIVYSGLTIARNAQWKDQVTLFRHDITVVENSAQAQNLLGVHLFLLSTRETDRLVQKQLREEAVPHFKKALEIYPDFLNASYDLGRTYEALQLSDQAFAQYQTTVKIDTHFVAPYFNMATILHNKKEFTAAIPYYEKFLTQYPKQLEAYTNLSFAYFQLKDFDNSIATNRRAITATGNAFYPTVNIAKTYTVMGKTDSALFYFEQAHAMQPNDGGVNLNIEKLKGTTP